MLAGAWWMLVGTHSHCVVKVLGERISDRLVQDTPGYCPAVRRTEVKVASLLPVTVVRGCLQSVALPLTRPLV